MTMDCKRRFTGICCVRSKLEACGSTFQFQNWGQGFTCFPKSVVQASSVREVQAYLNWIRANRLKCRCIGSGLSPEGLIQTNDNMLSISNMNRNYKVNKESRQITCDAGITIRQLCLILDKNELGLPNLGSICDQTLAGFISTGSHGSSAFCSIVTDLVIEFKIVLLDGSIKVCNAKENNELFRAALIGLGCFGVIVEYTLQAVEKYDIISQQVVLNFDDFQDLATDIEFWKSANFVRAFYYPIIDKVTIWKGQKANFKPKIQSRLVESILAVFNRVSRYLTYHCFQLMILLTSPKWMMLKKINHYLSCYFFNNPNLIHFRQIQDTSFNQLLANCWIPQKTIEYYSPFSELEATLERLEMLKFMKFANEINGGIEIRVIAPHSSLETKPMLTPIPGNCYYITYGCMSYKPFGINLNYESYFTNVEAIMKLAKGRPHWAKYFNCSKEELRQDLDFEKWSSLRQTLDPDNLFLNDYLAAKLYGDK